MQDTKVAKRYAKSILELSSERVVMDAVHEDMKLLLTTCKENHDLSLLLGNPIISSDKKLNILRQIFAGKMNALTIAFFEIITRKGRESYLESIAREFESLYKVLKGIRTAEIVSASGLDDNLRQQVYKILREGGSSEVELSEKVDQKLIGGFILRMGDKQYDASIASELRKLAQEFSVNPYIRKN